MEFNRRHRDWYDYGIHASLGEPVPEKEISINYDFNTPTSRYNCNKFFEIYNSYQKTNEKLKKEELKRDESERHELQRLQLRHLLIDPDFDCRDIDTIGPNKTDPDAWTIPNRSFRPFLDELGITEPYNQNIAQIIKQRKDAKTWLYRLTGSNPKSGGIRRMTRKRMTRKRKTARKRMTERRRRRSTSKSGTQRRTVQRKHYKMK